MDLKIFAKTVEDDQVMNLAHQEAFKDAKIRIMPDCHAGKGCRNFLIILKSVSNLP